VAIVLTINPSVGPTILENGVSRIITPMQSATSTSIDWVRGYFSAIGDNRQLVYNNRALQQEIDALRLENFRLQLAGEENAMLTALLDMNQRYGHLTVMGARVIAQNPNPWQRRFTLDRGTNDDIANNMAVLGDGGLIGVIRRVNPTSSHFVTVTDSEFSAAVMNLRTGDIGMVRGDIELMQQGLVRMDHIEAAAQIMPGDEIVTSTHSSIFPPGILLGTVVSIYPNPDGHTRHAIVRPAANLHNIEVVSIVTEIFGDATATRDGHVFVTED